MRSHGGRGARGVAIVVAVVALMGGAAGHALSEVRTNVIREGVKILAVGDSLTVGGGPFMQERLGDQIRVSARRGRPSEQGLRVLRRWFHPRQGVILFDLGSNDDHLPARQLLDNFRDAKRLVGQRCMIVSTVNPHSRDDLNWVIRNFADRHPTVLLFDWQRLTERRPELLSEDRIHATPHGYGVRAEQLIRVIRRCPFPPVEDHEASVPHNKRRPR